MDRSDLSEWELVKAQLQKKELVKAVGSNQEYDGLIFFIFIIEGFCQYTS